MSDINSEETSRQEYEERMWDEFEAWCRANENLAHE